MYGWLPLGPWRCVPTQAISSRLTKPRRICSMPLTDRKSTRLNSSHGYISYAVFCLKKKKKHSFISTYYTPPIKLLCELLHQPSIWVNRYRFKSTASSHCLSSHDIGFDKVLVVSHDL